MSRRDVILDRSIAILAAFVIAGAAALWTFTDWFIQVTTSQGVQSQTPEEAEATRLMWILPDLLGDAAALAVVAGAVGLALVLGARLEALRRARRADGAAPRA